MPVHHRVNPSIKFAATHLHTWVERGTVRVKCLAQEHNTMSPARVRTQTTRSRDECTNHEATAPPNFLMDCRTICLFLFLIIFLQIVGFALILSPVYSKVTDLFTSWPIVGGTISCGVFIMVIASVGIYGAVKHHQIVLFFVSFKHI